MPITDQERQAVMMAQEMNPDLEIPEFVPQPFDFTQLKEHPVKLKLDVGGSTYYSEIAATQTLDNLLQQKLINIVDYLERVPDERIPGRRALLDKKRRELEEQQRQQMMMGMMSGSMPPEGMPPEGAPPEGGIQDLGIRPDIPEGAGYSNLQRTINQTGDTRGLV